MKLDFLDYSKSSLFLPKPPNSEQNWTPKIGVFLVLLNIGNEEKHIERQLHLEGFPLKSVPKGRERERGVLEFWRKKTKWIKT